MQTGSLHWSESEETLFIGFDDGKVSRLKITDSTYTELGETALHRERVTGMMVIQNKLHSVSDLGDMKVSHTMTGEVHNEIWPSHPQTYALKSIMDLPGRNAFVVPDNWG